MVKREEFGHWTMLYLQWYVFFSFPSSILETFFKRFSLKLEIYPRVFSPPNFANWNIFVFLFLSSVHSMVVKQECFSDWQWDFSCIPVSTCIFIYFKYLSKKRRKRKKKIKEDVNITREGRNGRDTLLTN